MPALGPRGTRRVALLLAGAVLAPPNPHLRACPSAPQNYGNEPDAGAVLRPPMAADLGISDEQFVALRCGRRARGGAAGVRLGSAWGWAADS